jgi:hypothetical protein
MVRLSGFRGEVKEADEQNSIAKVAVQAFGSAASMDLTLGQIERVPKVQTEGGERSKKIQGNYSQSVPRAA